MSGTIPARRLAFAPWAFAGLYAAAGLVVMVWFAPKVPYADPWRFLATFLTLPFPANVLAPDNGHCEVLPNLVRTAELHLFDASQWLQVSTGVALALLTVLLWWRVIRAWMRPELHGAAALVVCLAVFWLGNERKLVHGNESVHLFLVLSCLVAGMHALAVPATTIRRGVFAGACGVAATFSFGSGIACFVAFAAVLALRRAPWREWAPVAAALAAALLLAVVLGGGSPAQLTLAPLRQLDLLVRWLGTPWLWAAGPLLDPELAARVPFEPLRDVLGAGAALNHAWNGPPFVARWPAFLFGAAGLLWLAAATTRVLLRAGAASPMERMGLGAAWFGCAVGGLVVVSRLDYFAQHPDQLTAQRYVPWSWTSWCGLVLAFVARADGAVGPRRLVAVALALVLLPSQLWMGRAALHLRTTADVTALGAAVGVIERGFAFEETAVEDLLRATPLLRAGGKAMFAWRETAALGSVPGAASVSVVAVDELRVRAVDNLFGTPGSAVTFRLDANAPARLLLLGGDGDVVGLATRLDVGASWMGWARGALDAGVLRVAALR